MTRTSRLLRSSVALLVVGTVVVTGRRLRAERAPRHGLGGSGAALGSFDTWPPVRRAPERPSADDA